MILMNRITSLLSNDYLRSIVQVETIIFVVDDDLSVRKSLARLLKSAGYRSETFASGPEFLKREPHRGPQCLILDVHLPGINGLEFQEMLSIHRADLPIIFITGYGDASMSARALKAGAIDFLHKPFDDEKLLNAVQQSLKKYKSSLT